VSPVFEHELKEPLVIGRTRVWPAKGGIVCSYCPATIPTHDIIPITVYAI
jgi:hypothetical protein